MTASAEDQGDVRAYIDAIDPAHRALFERLHHIVLASHPEAQVALAYGMPAYRVGARRLNLGAWKHGVSVYGWRRDNDGGFVARHPTLASGKATIRISTRAAASISDSELSDLLGGALDA
ncbi:MAG TPA: DUF1801 domain-containing protein [Acidimicrobiales bacterium]|nr:DUF1801 domain-containing protein [Acidimicrobiales bacterium]